MPILFQLFQPPHLANEILHAPLLLLACWGDEGTCYCKWWRKREGMPGIAVSRNIKKEEKEAVKKVGLGRSSKLANGRRRKKTFFRKYLEHWHFVFSLPFEPPPPLRSPPAPPQSPPAMQTPLLLPSTNSHCLLLQLGEEKEGERKETWDQTKLQGPSKEFSVQSNSNNRGQVGRWTYFSVI